jgi:hypothetical protein
MQTKDTMPKKRWCSTDWDCSRGWRAFGALTLPSGTARYAHGNVHTTLPGPKQIVVGMLIPLETRLR